MKKTLYLLPLLLLPVLLTAGVFQGLGIKHLGSMMPHSVSYRLQNQLFSAYDGENLESEARWNMHYHPNYHTRVDFITIDLYHPEINMWSEAASKVMFSYNAAGMVESTDMYDFYDGVWYLSFKLTAEYDSQNRLVRMCAYFDESGELLNSRMHIIYGTGTTFEYFIGDDNEDDYSRTSFQFDGQGRIIEEYEYSSADSVNWAEEYKRETTYHPQDTSTGADYISFISHNYPMLFLTQSDEFPGKVLLQTESEWHNYSWWECYRTVYTYDDQLRKTSSEEQYYGDEWRTDYRDLFYYDANGNPDYVIMQYKDWDADFMNDERIDFTWEAYTASSALVQVPVSDLRLKAYPVPFAGELSILAESKSSAPLMIGVYNQRGQLVRELSGLPGTNLSWDGRDQTGNSCGNGIYFLRASQGSSTATAKIVKLQ